MIKMVDLY